MCKNFLSHLDCFLYCILIAVVLQQIYQLLSLLNKRICSNKLFTHYSMTQSEFVSVLAIYNNFLGIAANTFSYQVFSVMVHILRALSKHVIILGNNDKFIFHCQSLTWLQNYFSFYEDGKEKYLFKHWLTFIFLSSYRVHFCQLRNFFQCCNWCSTVDWLHK